VGVGREHWGTYSIVEVGKGGKLTCCNGTTVDIRKGGDRGDLNRYL
jgi:hypothetical protein